MAKRLLMPLLAAIIIVAMVVPGCGDPVDPTDYSLTMAVAPAGTGTTIPSPGTTTRAVDAVIDITAEPEAGYYFTGWTATAGSFVSAASVRINQFIMPAADVTVTANFAEIPEGHYVVSMAVSPEGTGTAVDVAGEPFYEQGTSVAISAEPIYGYHFDGWSSDPAGVVFDDAAEADTTFTMPENDVTITAAFVYQVAPAGWEPVEIRMAIRDNLPPWPESGDWIADKFEELHSELFNIGFVVERIYGDSPGLWAYWGGTHPIQGKSHIYTGGWISSAIPRDSGGIFDQMYTGRVMPFHPWTFYEYLLETGDPAAECQYISRPANPTRWWALDEASRRLRFREYTTLTEREGYFRTVIEDGRKFSIRNWVVDVAGLSPFSPDLRVVGDVAGGIGDPGWVHTLHFHDAGTPIAPDGSTVVRIELPDVFIENWNPVEGSPWSYDMFVTRRALGDAATMSDPREGETGGLYWPQRLASVEVLVAEGLPVGQTIPSGQWGDGLSLETRTVGHPDLIAPADAWADWDADAQEWITVLDREAAEDPADWVPTALTRTTVVYEADLWDIELHDGSTLTPADFLMAMIMSFDRGKPGSPIFDSSEQSPVAVGLNSLKGIQIESLDPLTITTWHDTWYLDVEWFAARNWFPQYGTYGWTAFWHNVAVGWAAEADNTGFTGDIAAVFSKAKEAELSAYPTEPEWMDYTKGPTLAVLALELGWCVDNAFMPYYDAILAVYEDAGLAWTGDDLDKEIGDRWAALNAFYTAREHFWVGNGPFELLHRNQLDPTEQEITIHKFEGYQDDGYKWFFFFDPEPTPGVANLGAWVDVVQITREASHADAVTRLQTGGSDLFAHPVTDPFLVEIIETELSSFKNFGSYRELTFNPYRDPDTMAPFFDGEFTDLNPFAISQIREATNYMMNRPLFVGEHLGGLGAPKWTALGTAFPDHALYYDDIIEQIELDYRYRPELASKIIYEEMYCLGARLYYNPAEERIVWHFNYD